MSEIRFAFGLMMRRCQLQLENGDHGRDTNLRTWKERMKTDLGAPPIRKQKLPDTHSKIIAATRTMHRWMVGAVTLLLLLFHPQLRGTPFSETKLTALDGVAGDNFGFAVAMSGDGNSVIVGAVSDEFSRGSVYASRWNGSQWTESKLTADDGVAGDAFGWSVAMSSDGNSLVVGAILDNASQGAAYVYHWNGSQWVEIKKLTASDGFGGDQFGYSVAVSGDGDAVVVGSYLGNGAKGAVYVYRWDGLQWEEAKLTASDGQMGDNFGWSAGMDTTGNSVIVGAYLADSAKGSAYIYGWDGAQWLETKLTASDGLIGDDFGFSVAMSADANSVVVGAYRADSNKGSAYVFGWDGTQWGEIKKLIASDGAVGDDFGISVATSASGNSVIIGAAFDDSSKGSAYVYFWDGIQWVEQKLTADDGEDGDNFGRSVAMNGDSSSALVGAYLADSARGSAYVYRSANVPPLVILPAPATLNCAPAEGLPVSIEVTVTDPDSGQTLTVTLKEGITVLDVQNVATPINNTVVTFATQTFLPGLHELTIEISDAIESFSGTTSILVNPGQGVPEVISTPGDATLECPDTVVFGDPQFSGGCGANLTVSFADTSLPVVGKEVSKTQRTWTATDDAAQFVSTSQTITVQDTTAPVISDVPANITAPATGPSGAVVLFPTPTATDICDGVVPVTCALPSGSTFPIGTTLVSCTATDGHGNSAGATFTVRVKGATEQIRDLIRFVIRLPIDLRVKRKLVEELGEALLKPGEACEELKEFTQIVREERGRRLTIEQATQLLDEAARIRAVLGCRADREMSRRDDSRGRLSRDED